MKPQTKAVLSFMKRNRWITPREALNVLGCERLAARIGELKDSGIEIHRELVRVKTRNGETRVARYSLT